MLINTVVVLFVLISAIRTTTCYEAKEEGTVCQQLGLGGVCRQIENCPVALQSLMKRGRHDLLRCGFVGKREVVCCPGDLPSDRHPSLETSTIDESTVWSGENGIQSNSKDKNMYGNGGRIKAKRRAELMCEKMYKEINVTLEITYHVLNGEDAEVGQFPHMAALGFEDEYGNIDWAKCGASLISPRYLLTAAHCAACQGCAKSIVKARLGVINKQDSYSAQDIDVKNITLASYDITSKHNDIALIELAQDVKMSKTIYPACLYAEADDPIGLIVSGWGQTDSSNSSSRSDVLQFARLMPVAVERCNSSLLARNKHTSKVILNSQICARSNQSDACVGDSGGPLQIERKTGGYDIVGIVSYGVQCGTILPGIYTRVSAYLDWIEEHVWPS